MSCDAMISKGLVYKAFKRWNALLMPFLFADCTEMMGLIGAGNNPMVGATVAVAVEEASK